MKEKKFLSINNRIGILVFAGILITISALVIYSTIKVRKLAIRDATEIAVSQAENYASKIKTIFDEAMTGSRTVAEMVSAIADTNFNISIDRNGAEGMSKNVLLKHDYFIGLTLAWEPDAFDNNDAQYVNTAKSDKTGRFLSYLTKKDSDIVIEPLVDYEPEAIAPWYWIPKRQKNEFVTEPVLYPIQGVEVFMISFMAPIMVNNQFLGVTGIDIKVDFLQNLVKNANIYNGIADIAVVSNGGMFAANSRNEAVIGKNIADMYENHAELLQVIKDKKKKIVKNDKEILIFVPIEIGHSNTPWQVSISLPLHVINKEANKTMYAMVGIGLFLTIISLSILYFFIRSSLKPLINIVDIIKKIAKGDLREMPKIYDRNDEIYILAKAMKEMVLKLREVVSSVLNGAENITSASNQISSGSQQLSQGANEQASSTEEVSSSMEEMVSNIQQNTDNAQQTEKISKEATESIMSVAQAAEESLDSTRQIASKISVVNDIAFQTNILALNAAVEAARAGEHGKGFAVVAGEVRKLAERSKVAADEIIKLSNDSLRLTENAGKLMNKLKPEIEHTSKLVQEISAASLEQNSGAEQVNNAVQQLNQITQENAAASEELATSSEEMSSQAQQLKENISYFTIDKEVKKELSQPKKEEMKKKVPSTSKTIHTTSEKPSLKKINKKENGFALKMYDDKIDNEFESF